MKRILIVSLCLLGAANLVAQDLITLMSGNQAYTTKNWTLAEKSYRKIVQKNPYNGEHHYKLGWIFFQQKKYQEAAERFSVAFDIGYSKALSSYNAACALALQGNKEEAMRWLERSLKNGLQDHESTVRSDSDLAALKSLPDYLQLFPTPNPDMRREAGWSTDIAYFKRKFQLMHYQLFSLVDRATWDDKLNKLTGDIPKLTDAQIIVRLMQLAHDTGAGHSYVVPPFQGQFHLHQLPIELYEFSDGIYVRKAHEQYKHFLGKKVLAVEGRPIEEVLEVVKTVANPENAIIARWSGLFYLTLTDVLQGLGLAESIEKVSLTVETNGNKETLQMESSLFDPSIVMSKALPNGWVDATGKLPAYYRRANESFWMEVDQEQELVYAQVNQVRNGNGQSFSDFARQIVNAAKENKSALVLDLRLNNGGNGLLVKDFLLEIIRSEHVNQWGNFYVLIGRKTFSAAMLLSAKLDEYTNAIFVGEPTGSKPTHVGDDNNFVLPYSGLIVSASMTLWQSAVSYDDREWIAPDIFVPMSLREYLEGEDPVRALIPELVKEIRR